MNRPDRILFVSAAFAAAVLSPVSAPAQQPGLDADSCGWYVILGCSRERAVAENRLAELGGPGVGGGAGTHVIETRLVRGFRPGYFCLADGPYVSREDAGSVAWIEAVPDAYVKRGC